MAVIRNNLQILHQRLDRYLDWFLVLFTAIRNNLQIPHQRLDRYLDWFLALSTLIFAVIFAVVMFSDSVSTQISYLSGADNKKEALKFIVLIVSGLMSFMGILVLRQRVRGAEKQTEIMRGAASNQAEAAKSQAKANELTEVGHTQDRLKTSIEHLGSDKLSVRIGAAYELYHLAKDRQNYRETVCGILCNHIRQKTQEAGYRKKQKNRPSGEIRTFLDLLCGEARENPFSQCQIDLSHSFLWGVSLRGAQLRGANLQRAHLWLANLSKAQLRGADLRGATLRGSILSGAHLEGANLLAAQLWQVILRGARLQGASLLAAQLQGANLSGAQLQGTSLSGAQLHGADLSGAQLQAADLSGAELQVADLSRAWLQGADLSGAQLQETDLSGARLQGISSSRHSGGNFQDRMRAGIGRESDFSNVVSSGGLSATQTEEIKKGIAYKAVTLESEEGERLEDRLNKHTYKEAVFGLPDNSGAITGAYTKDEAEKWIAEYEKSTGYQSVTDESKSAAAA